MSMIKAGMVQSWPVRGMRRIVCPLFFTKTIRDEGGITPKAVIETCPNCKITWPGKD